MASRSSLLQYALLVLLFLPIYWIGGRVGLYLRASFGDVTPIWPPSGLAVALFIGRGVKFWPVPLLGETLIALTDGQPLIAGFIVGVAQILEALVAWLLLRKTDLGHVCESSRSVIRFTILGVILPPVVASLVGSLTHFYLHRLTPSTFWGAFFVWWTGDAIGVLVLSPILLELTRARPQPRDHETFCKLALLLAAMSVAGISVITSLSPKSEYFFFLLLAFVVIATIRFGMCGAMGSTLLMTAIVYGLRPHDHPDADLVTTVRMLFVGISTFTAYLLAGFLRERATAENRLREMNEAMQRAQKIQALGTLAGGIAHDFNNIITSISGLAEVAQKLHLTDPHAVSQDLEQIQIACRRATELTRQILSFCRPGDAHMRESNIVPLCEEAVRLFRATLPPTTSLELQTDCQAAWVRCTETQIHQVLINLLTNALHALPNRSGQIEVRLSLEDVPAEEASRAEVRAGRFAVISVSDNGVGMTPEIVERIFDPYFSTKAPGQGTGLGLTVVQGIVRGLGGFIRVESEPGKGTTMRIYLPLVEPVC